MIIGPDFVWLHWPKCGGTATEIALRKLLSHRRDISFDEIDDVSGVWHDSIYERQKRSPSFDPEGRRIISGIRRLPYWLLSISHFEISRGEQPATREMILEGKVYTGGGLEISADQVIGSFNKPRIDSWIRTENMSEDIARTFNISNRTVKAALREKNVGMISYVKKLSFWFTSKELSGLYSANPIWASAELEAYGDILTAT